MRRLWAVAVVAAVMMASGCGTIVNLTDIDNKGREPYGGYHRDLDFFFKRDPDARPSTLHLFSGGTGKGALAALALITAACVAYVGVAATETSLSLAGDAVTAPAVPLIDHLLGYDALPSLNPKGANRVALIPASTALPIIENQKIDDPPEVEQPVLEGTTDSGWYKSNLDPPTEIPLPPALGLKRYFELDPPKPSETPITL